jgi:4a-hydroxytetrahydrobiopterin dehydratase
LARKISSVAEANGLMADPTAVTQLEVGLDTAHEDRIGPFWSVLLTGSPDNKVYDSIFDPTGRLPAIWFQSTEDHESPRQRWHFDLWLAPEVADERIAAAVSIGGSVVDASGGPSFTVLADPDGNRVCICTAVDR